MVNPMKYFGSPRRSFPMKYFGAIRRPGNRAGVQVMIGPLGLDIAWPLVGSPIFWYWGWWSAWKSDWRDAE